MGVFDRMMEGLASEGGDQKTNMIDAISLKAHCKASSLRAKTGERLPARTFDWAHQGWLEHQAACQNVCQRTPPQFFTTARQISD